MGTILYPVGVPLPDKQRADIDVQRESVWAINTGSRPSCAACRSAGHQSPVLLPDGTQLAAASFDPVAPYSRVREPDYGLYFDFRWQPPWEHDHVDWPDFGVPASAEALVEALKTVLDRAQRAQAVEVGCIGGHGRTGTALACLAVLTGHPAQDAVAWVRSKYCAKAVETPAQQAFIAAIRNS